MNAAKQLEDAVFFTALNLADLEQRKLFLDQACAGNSELRAAVEELLSAQGNAEHFFSKGASALNLPADEIPAAIKEGISDKTFVDEQIGTKVGPYKLLQKLGEGGCGVVYMAEQEKPVKAVKVRGLGAAAQQAFLAHVQFVLQDEFEELAMTEPIGGFLQSHFQRLDQARDLTMNSLKGIKARVG